MFQESTTARVRFRTVADREGDTVRASRSVGIGINGKSSVKIELQGKIKPDLKSIGARVRKLRGEILQDKLALQLGISQGQLSKIERGLL